MKIEKRQTDHLAVQVDVKNLRVVRGFVVKCLGDCNVATEMLENRICLAVDEAFTNVIRHGRPGETQGKVDIYIDVDAEKFSARLVGLGDAFDHERIGLSIDILRQMKDKVKGGLGVYIIRRVMDEVEYRFPDGGKSELRLTKYFNTDNNVEAEERSTTCPTT